MFFLFLFRVRLSSFKLAIPSLMSCLLYLKLSSVMVASPSNMFRDSSSLIRKTKVPVKQHDAEINTGYVTTSTSFSRLNSRDGNSRGYILSRRQPQQLSAETSIVATTQSSSPNHISSFISSRDALISQLICEKLHGASIKRRFTGYRWRANIA